MKNTQTKKPVSCLKRCYVTLMLALATYAPTTLACTQQAKCVASANTLQGALLAQIKHDPTFVKQTGSLGGDSKTATTKQLASYVDVILFDLNGDYLKDALVRQKPKTTEDNSAYPLYIYQHVGTDDQPVFKKASRINNAMLPVMVLEKQTKGWRDIVINTNQHSATYASALFQHNGKHYIRSSHAFLGAVLTTSSDNQRIAEYSECIEKKHAIAPLTPLRSN